MFTDFMKFRSHEILFVSKTKKVRYFGISECGNICLRVVANAFIRAKFCFIHQLEVELESRLSRSALAVNKTHDNKHSLQDHTPHPVGKGLGKIRRLTGRKSVQDK